MIVHSICALAVFLLAIAPDALADTRIAGTLRDTTGGAVADAEVVLLSPSLSTVATTRSDSRGEFALDAPAAGSFLLLVRAAGFDEARRAITIADGTTPAPLAIVLQVGGLSDDVTVTASREAVEAVRRAAQPVNVIDEAEIAARVKTVVAQAVNEEAGVALQRTSSTMAGIFVRGLTGNKVNVFVDGVR